MRRRLATAFYFNSLANSQEHSHRTVDLHQFTQRLDDAEFKITSQTDYRELSALASLLDVAVDDGQRIGLDLSRRDVCQKFDQELDVLSARIKGVVKGIGNPGAAFMSRMQARDVLDLVSQRISNTLRQIPKPKHTWVAGPALKKAELDLAESNNANKQKAAMSKFVSKYPKNE